MIALARAFLLLILAAALAAPLRADQAEVDKGRMMAERLCATCHMGERQQEKQGPMGIPGFRAIASRPAQTQSAIVEWLLSKPAMMPDHHLSQDEAYALAAFIFSLRDVP